MERGERGVGREKAINIFMLQILVRTQLNAMLGNSGTVCSGGRAFGKKAVGQFVPEAERSIEDFGTVCSSGREFGRKLWDSVQKEGVGGD